MPGDLCQKAPACANDRYGNNCEFLDIQVGCGRPLMALSVPSLNDFSYRVIRSSMLLIPPALRKPGRKDHVFFSFLHGRTVQNFTSIFTPSMALFLLYDCFQQNEIVNAVCYLFVPGVHTVMLGTGKAHVVNGHDMLCQHPAKSFRLRTVQERRSRLPFQRRKPVRFIRGVFFFCPCETERLRSATCSSNTLWYSVRCLHRISFTRSADESVVHHAKMQVLLRSGSSLFRDQVIGAGFAHNSTLCACPQSPYRRLCNLQRYSILERIQRSVCNASR